MMVQNKYVYAPKTKRLYYIRGGDSRTGKLNVFDLISYNHISSEMRFVRMFWLQVGDEIEIIGKTRRYNIRILDFVWSKKELAYKVKYHNMGGKANNFSYGLLDRLNQNFIKFLN